MARQRRTAQDLKVERRRQESLARVPDLRKRARAWFIRGILLLPFAIGIGIFFSFLGVVLGIGVLALLAQGLRVAIQAQRIEQG